MTTSAPATGSRVRSVGPHLLIAPEETAAALTAALSGLPPLPDALLVLAAAPDSAPVLRRALPDLVALAGERGATRLVLAASGLAAPGPHGSRPVETVAATADFTVIAPDGVVSIEPDGALRIGEPGTWWLTEPGAEPRELAAGWPPGAGERESGQTGSQEPEAAAPDDGLPAQPGDEDEDPPVALRLVPDEDPGQDGSTRAASRTGRDGEPAQEEEPLPAPVPPVPVVAESRGGAHGFGAAPSRDESHPVPGGLWLGRLPEAAESLIGVGPGTFLLGVGSPRQPALTAAELLDRVPEAAADSQDVLLAAPWAAPSELTAMAVALADHFGRTVRVVVGLPVRMADDHATTILDERGAPTWQPPLFELAASPEHRRVVPSAWLRLPGMDALTPALHRCADLEGWVLESVPAGLWLRPAGQVQDSRPRMLRPDPARPVLVVGDGEQCVGPEIRQALPGVLAALPDLGAAEPYGLLVHGNEPDGAAGRPRAVVPDPRRPGPTTSGSAPEVRTGQAPPQAAVEPAGSAPEPVEPGEPEVPPLPEPDEGPAPTTPPAGPHGGDDPASRAVSVPAAAAAAEPTPGPGVRSGPRDRVALRGLLGERYHILAGRTELLASRLPSLRSTVQDDLKPDMVAIALYQADSPDPVSRAGLAEAARAAAPGPFTPLLRCLGSGLRRLPGHYGAVMLAAPAQEVPLDRYVPGAVFVEPAAVAAVPACDVELGGAVEFGIWSTTGRRTSVFLGTDDEPEVVFPPGTAFSVLALHLPQDDASPIRVLLREVSPADARSADGTDDRFRQRDAQARTRLTDWFERRDMLEPHDRRTLSSASRFHVAPGAALR